MKSSFGIYVPERIPGRRREPDRPIPEVYQVRVAFHFGNPGTDHGETPAEILV
jgi:hypothetical protein